LRIAVRYFFYEIAEDILISLQERNTNPVKHAKEMANLPLDEQYLIPIDRPFNLWIAHGTDLVTAMERTVQVCKDYDIISCGNEMQTPFMAIVDGATVEDDFILISVWIKKFPLETVKQLNCEGESAAGSMLHMSYLHHAISDSVIAARILLEKGVDVN
jgi:hypothetical protein